METKKRNGSCVAEKSNATKKMKPIKSAIEEKKDKLIIKNKVLNSQKKTNTPEQVKEQNSREAVRIAQQSTIELIRAAAKKFEAQRTNEFEDDAYLEILAPRKRGRPPKNERVISKNNPFYEPEFNGLMEEKQVITPEDKEHSAYHRENEIIDFWTDDDIPLAKGWKDDILEF